MGLIELGGIAALGCAIGLYPGIHHLITFRKKEAHLLSVEAVDLIAHYIYQARSSVDIVSGELSPFVFDPLAPLIRHRLEMMPNLTFRFIASSRILGLRSNPSRRPQNRLYTFAKTRPFPERFEMRITKTRPNRHFGLVDTLHLYVEESHTSDRLGRDVTIYKNSGLTAIKFQSRFDEMWRTIEQIPLDSATLEVPKLEMSNPEEAHRIIKEAERLPILQPLQTA